MNFYRRKKAVMGNYILIKSRFEMLQRITTLQIDVLTNVAGNHSELAVNQ